MLVVEMFFDVLDVMLESFKRTFIIVNSETLVVSGLIEIDYFFSDLISFLRVFSH
jgi:hypothetical protein